MTEFIELTLPVLFWEDHVARDLPGGEVQAYKGNDVVVRLDAPTYDELLSDADYYSTLGSLSPGDGIDELRESAIVTVDRMKAVWPD